MKFASNEMTVVFWILCVAFTMFGSAAFAQGSVLGPAQNRWLLSGMFLGAVGLVFGLLALQHAFT